MIKVIKTIVNTNRRLIGLVMEGRDSELDGFSDEKVTKPMTLTSLVNRGFENNQISIGKQGLRVKGNFRLNDIPMLVLVDGKFIEVDNGVSIIKRFVQDEQVIGFQLRFGDNSTDQYNYANVVNISNWFKPRNYVVRVSSGSKAFIAGKSGMLKLEDLPTQYIGESVENDSGKVRSQTSNSAAITGQLINNADILDLYEFIQQNNGLIIKLPDESYKAASKNLESLAPAFHPLGIGEYAYPFIDYSEVKINANTTFRKPGMISVNFNQGAGTNIQTYVFAKKHIFLNGNNYIDRFGIAIPNQAEEEFIKRFAKSMAVNKITNTLLIQSISALTSKSGLVFYEVDTNKLALIDQSKFSSYILNAYQIKDLLTQVYGPKLRAKYLSGLINLNKKLLRVDPDSIGQTPFGFFAGMSEDYRRKVSEAGIDIYTGAYRRVIGLPRDPSEVYDDSSDIAIEYRLNSQNYKKMTFAKLASSPLSNNADIPADVAQLIEHYRSMNNPEEIILRAKNDLASADERIDEIKKTLWLHKCSMYLQSNRTSIHSHDKDSWELDTTRKAKAKCYTCKESECTDLMVAILNTTI